MFKKAAKDSIAQLHLWSKEELGDRNKKLEESMKELKSIKQQNFHYKDGDHIQCVERQINNFLIDEEIYWEQRSRSDWLRAADRKEEKQNMGNFG